MQNESLPQEQASSLQSLEGFASPITLSQLNEMLPPYHDEVIPGVGRFRFHRLSAIDVLDFQSTIGEISDESQTADKVQYIRCAMAFVSKSLGGEFATERGKETLMSLPFEIQTPLISAAIDASRANIGKRVVQVEAAKNE